jgi:hypothetical protein
LLRPIAIIHEPPSRPKQTLDAKKAALTTTTLPHVSLPFIHAERLKAREATALARLGLEPHRMDERQSGK